jgi:hypothetical protein
MKGVALLVCALALCATTEVSAQDGEQAGADETAASDQGAGDASAEAQHGEAESGKEPEKAAPGSHNWSFGPYLRFVVVPSFMLKLFLDEAPSPSNLGFGVSATYRSDSGSPNVDLGIGYTSYSFTGPFRTKGGDANDTEFVESNLGLVHVTGSILWETPIVEDKLGFQYGVGLDLGIVTGKMVRTEAYPVGNGWAKCAGPGNPASEIAYCQPPQTAAGATAGTDPYNVKGEQYGVIEKSIPPVMAFPMLPRLGLRYAPIHPLWFRLDAAYGIAQFWLGLTAAYVPDM